MNDYIKNWLRAALIRALKTIAQTAIATIGTSAVLGDVNWPLVGSAALLAGILSLLTSLAGLPEVKGMDEALDEEEKDIEQIIREASEEDDDETDG